MNTCQAKGCLKVTNFNKPYCSDHVELCDYAANLIYQQEVRRKEADAIKRLRTRGVDLDGFLVEDVLALLNGGTLHYLDRAHRLLNIEFVVLLEIANALEKSGIVTRVGITDRSEGALVLSKAIVA